MAFLEVASRDMTSSPLRIRIGTRSSALALAQAHQVAAQLNALGVDTELKEYTTIGDRILDRPLSAIGEKGLFTAELEADLRDGITDCAVHSLKDLPTADPDGLDVVALLEREDPRDAFVARAGSAVTSLEALPPGARVGTSSLRRRAQLLALRPDLVVCELRGNVGTRLRKLDDGEVDAALLAAAGLRRLGLGDRITSLLNPPHWLSAPGQGAIAVQARASDDAVRAVLARLDHAPTREAITAERTLLGTLEGGCQVPIGAAVVMHNGTLMLHGLIADVRGETVLRSHAPVDRHAPAAAGTVVAEALLRDGAQRILDGLRQGAHTTNAGGAA
jgi:hydroxymethylbilane synthase